MYNIQNDLRNNLGFGIMLFGMVNFNKQNQEKYLRFFEGFVPLPNYKHNKSYIIR